MTLSFTTEWPDKMGDLAGQPNYFIQKIWASLGLPATTEGEYIATHADRFGVTWDLMGHRDHRGRPMMAAPPKFHTIRKDPAGRWRPGMKIHPVINNRTKDRFQFAPVLECTGVQNIQVRHAFPHRYIFIDGKYIPDWNKMNQLALNDGFPSVEGFFAWFNEDFSGKIIRWTDLRY